MSDNLNPITREELFLAKAAGMNVQTPTPITRVEKFLDRIGKTGGNADLSEVYNQLDQLSKAIADKADKSALSLGFGSDGKLYIMISGAPYGNGVEINGTVVPSGSVAVISWDFGELTEIPSEFTVRGDAEQVEISDGVLNITNSGLKTNIVDIERFESDYCRLDYWATYPINEDAWNCFVAWGYGSKWRGENSEQVGIYSAITSEIDIFEQGMPNGATYETGANNVYAGSNISVYEVWGASGGYDLGAGEEHKFSLVKNKNIITWLFDDVEVRTVDATALKNMPITSEYTVERNTLLLPHWFNIYCQSKGVSDGSNIFKIRKIQFSTIDGAEIKPTAIALTNDYISGTAPVGAKLLMIKTFTPDTTFNKYTTWRSSDENVAVVSETGVVTCLAEGNCVITATAINGVEGTYALSVDNTAVVPCRKIKVDNNGMSLSPGESKTIELTTFPSYTSDEVLWKTSNESVATVVDGAVTGISVGDAIITVTVGNHVEEITVGVTQLKQRVYYGENITSNVENAFVFDMKTSHTVVWDITPTGNYWKIGFINLSNGYDAPPRLSGVTTPQIQIVASTQTDTIETSWKDQRHKVASVYDADTATQKTFVDGTLYATHTGQSTFANTNYQSGNIKIRGATACPQTLSVYNYAMTDEEAIAATTL